MIILNNRNIKILKYSQLNNTDNTRNIKILKYSQLITFLIPRNHTAIKK